MSARPATGEVECAAAGHDRAQALEGFAELPGARLVNVERGNHVLVRDGDLHVARAHPGEDLIDPVVRTGDETVQRHGHVSDYRGHSNLQF